MRSTFTQALHRLYEGAGMRTTTNGVFARPALVLTDRVIRREVADYNLEVLVVLAFAINPSKFTTHVEVYVHPDQKDVFRFKVKDTGNLYQLTTKDVFHMAIDLLIKNGRQSEVLVKDTPRNPQPRSQPCSP